ncbi:hypothetical protein VTO42DRAFT_3448 [Malbranchea cinnamomea]
MTTTPPRVPIPANGVDYRGKVVLAPMVRSGELPSRLLALKYGADLVWGPETVDRALIGANRRINPRNSMIEFTRFPSNGGRTDAAAKESVIYRIDPVREKGKLIFQLGTASPELAVQAAKVIAGDVSGIDVNAGCPKPFSTAGGMGAALLKTPDRLVSILESLVREVGSVWNIGISVKIRLLAKPEDTEQLVTRLCRTGITGLTVHCRTTPMRPREPAIRDQLRMIASICRNAGVACVMNGDVKSRDQALELIQEYGVDGAMIATAAESNFSCFRTAAQGGLLPWRELAHDYLEAAMECENKWGNTKFLLNIIVPGKERQYNGAKQSKSYEECCRILEFDDLVPRAQQVDEILGLGKHRETQKAAAVQKAMTQNETAKAAGGSSMTKEKSPDLSLQLESSGPGPIRRHSSGSSSTKSTHSVATSETTTGTNPETVPQTLSAVSV